MELGIEVAFASAAFTTTGANANRTAWQVVRHGGRCSDKSRFVTRVSRVTGGEELGMGDAQW
jgi:hypothetical protein